MRGHLSDLTADPRLQGPKGEIVVVIGPARAEAASEADADAALRLALQTLGPVRGHAEVARQLGLNCRDPSPRRRLQERMSARRDLGENSRVPARIVRVTGPNGLPPRC